VVETPRSEISASLRDLYSGSKWLPWTSIIFLDRLPSGQSGVAIGCGDVFSRAANGRIGRGIHGLAIAVRVAAKRPDAGSAGGPASSTGLRATAESGGGNRVGAIGSAAGNEYGRQLTLRRCARASA
jgi:hypothetical protein